MFINVHSIWYSFIFSTLLTKRSNFCDFLFASLSNEAFTLKAKTLLLLQQIISKLYVLEQLTPLQKEAKKIKNDWVISSEIFTTRLHQVRRPLVLLIFLRFFLLQNRKIRTHAVAREQMEKFDNYCRAMKNKVERQRAERQRYNEELQERLRAQEEIVSTLSRKCPVDF